ncbi:GAF domain-containing SpoIIE family protein phosphatase [Chondrinema litorale]|uniref:GAF domain-containing SpoIIE family protein phosphatase n=1 Tax=Chondrinema litorale TaxID=2994555 RepID=UPI00254277AA|nr:SpoIIE family protein phosphatase [Chondrinema litorale]UZR95869.1 SpoIIE family protein phosphatase [Chondrinema litorale]
MSKRVALRFKFVLLGVLIILVTVLPLLLINPYNEDYAFIISWVSLLFILLGILTYFSYKDIVLPVDKIIGAIVTAQQGKKVNQISYSKDNEFGQVISYINGVVVDLDKAASFVKEIDEGKLDAKLEISNKDIELASALENFRERMVNMVSEENKRNWVNEGLNKFSEVIRVNNSSLAEMGDAVLKHIVKYLNASQGALFVATEENGNTVLNMESCYALNRKKYINKKIGVKEGIVGQAYLEKDIIHLREIPENYFEIVSGLGNIQPTSILVFPLIENEVTYGVIEIASLHKFEDYQITFLKDLGETIANNIANIINIENTQKLLTQSQKQAEMLRSQEEEMRQNMEELETTQEQMKRKQLETEHANNKLKENELKLQDAYQESQKQSDELREKTKELEVREVTLKRNMEELQAARDEMNKRNLELERITEKLEANEAVLKKAYNQTKEKERAIRHKNGELEKNQMMIQQQKDELESKNIYLTDSIKYAKRIQSAILPDKDNLQSAFASYFVIFMPKDMVSGDFYWFAEIDNRKFIAAIDCTGHGVPGAFMSLIGHSLLNQITKERHIYNTNEILEYLNEGIIEALKQGSTTNVDGMDVSLCCVESLEGNKSILHYTGAKCPAFYIPSDNKLHKLKPDRRSIGGYQKENQKPFKMYSIELETGDKVFLTTDGLIDSPDKNRKRFGTKKLENLLTSAADKPVYDIKDALMSEFMEYTEGCAQRDDITFIGLEIR